MNNKLKSFTICKETKRMIIVCTSIFLLMVALRPTLFLRSANINSMMYQLPELGLYSMAMMLVMLSGGIDLSIVPVGNLACIVAAKILANAVASNASGFSLFGYTIYAFSGALFVGVICGLLNGFLVTTLKLSPMLITMATSSIITGFSIVITQGKSVSGIPEELLYFGNHTLLFLPYSLWVFIIITICIAFLLNKHSFGFKLKFVGANPNVSTYSGINNKAILIKTYLLCSLLSAICGIEILLKTNTGKADYASTYVLQAILCAVLGATNPDGGFAKVSTMILSLLSLQFLSSGFNLLRLGGYYKDFSWGVLLLVVLSMDFIISKIKLIKIKGKI